MTICRNPVEPEVEGGSRSVPRWALAAGGALAVAAISASALFGFAFQQDPDFRDSPFLRVDPERITLDQRDSRIPCGECHVAEYGVWEETTHATGFDTMHRTQAAQDILRDMGLSVTKRQESLCMRCHYTVKAPQLRAVAGVSCESCHGPALEWKDVHNQWGPGVEHPDQEDQQHEEERIRESVEGGMLRPSGDLYAVTANCFECHTVPFEDLVNVGGHTPGSSGFDLVERIDQIQHNFVEAQWGASDANREPTVERTRLTFVIGRILDYEFSIRALSEATAEGRFSKAMDRRIAGAARELDAIGRVIEIPEVSQILQAGSAANKAPDNRNQLQAAAEQIRSLGQAFASGYTGGELAALDPLLAGEAVAPPSPAPESPPAEGAQAGTDPAAGAADSGTATEQPATTDAAGTPEAAEASPEPSAPAAPTLPGRIRSRPAWFDDSGPYQTVADPDDCVSCHIQAEDWWYDDAHYSTAQRLLNREARATEIAGLYGITAQQMTRGDQICMGCHGTVESAAPNVDVLVGVSCESCHGPSSEYREPHEDGGNPQLGMVNLKDPAARAANCVRCHHITDDRLLAAGHPSGDGYDIGQADQAIEHYPDERRVGRARTGRGESYPAFDRSALAGAFAAARSARPTPQVQVVQSTTSPAPSRPSTSTPTSTRPPRAAPTANLSERSVSTPPATVTPRPQPRGTAENPAQPVQGAADPGGAGVTNPTGTTPDTANATETSDPEVGAPPTSTEELLLDVKRRLEALFRRLGRGN